jgi:hypothetical protein
MLLESRGRCVDAGADRAVPTFGLTHGHREGGNPPCCHISLPRKGHRVGLRIVLCEVCTAFTRVTACTHALSPNRDTHSEGFGQFVTSVGAPVTSGWSILAGGIYTHWKAPPFHGAHPNRSQGGTLPRCWLTDYPGPLAVSSVTRRANSAGEVPSGPGRRSAS